MATENVPADELLILNIFIVGLLPWKRTRLEQASKVKITMSLSLQGISKTLRLTWN